MRPAQVLAGAEHVHMRDGTKGGVGDGASFPDEHEGSRLFVAQVDVAKAPQPRPVVRRKEVMEQECDHELVALAVGLEGRGREADFVHQLPHDPDAAALGFSEVGVVKDGGNDRVAGLRARLAQSILGDEGMAGIANLQPVPIADDLHRALHPIAAMHNGVYHRLADDAVRHERDVCPVKLTRRERECLGQAVQNGCPRASDERDQWGAKLDGLEAAIRIGHPFPAGHPDAAHPHHGEPASQGLGSAKDQDAGGGGPENPVLSRGIPQCVQEFLIVPADCCILASMSWRVSCGRTTRMDTLPDSRNQQTMVPAEGVEPTRPYGHQILSLARLPIPPRRPTVCHADPCHHPRLVGSL